MKLPFIISKAEFDAIKPRKHLGQRRDLNQDTAEILDTVDVLDQRSEWLANAAIMNRYLLILVFIACLPQIYALIQLWVHSAP